jgi:hypothetical protein
MLFPAVRFPLLARTAATHMRPGGSYRGKTGHASLWCARRLMTHSDHQRLSFAVLHNVVVK